MTQVQITTALEEISQALDQAFTKMSALEQHLEKKTDVAADAVNVKLHAGNASREILSARHAMHDVIHGWK